jgi:hypothetical protein
MPQFLVFFYLFSYSPYGVLGNLLIYYYCFATPLFCYFVTLHLVAFLVQIGIFPLCISLVGVGAEVLELGVQFNL